MKIAVIGAKLGKLSQIGRILFCKGIVRRPAVEIPFDSRSPAYYMLTVQESRARFCDLGAVLASPRAYRNPVRLLKTFLLWPVRYWQLKAALRIAEAYVLESKLLELNDDSRSRRRP